MGLNRSVLAVAVAVLACAPGEGPREAAPAPSGTEPAPPSATGAGDTTGAAVSGSAAAAEYAATDALVEAQQSYENGEVREALRLAERVISDHAGTSAVVPAHWVGARAAFAAGDYGRAGELALAYAATQPAGSALASEARVLADLAEDALARPSAAPALVGVLLPRSGDRALVHYADLVLQGIQVAEAELEARFGREIELVVADDAGGSRTAEAVAELERRGVVAIVGPLLPQQVPVAARARQDQDLVMVSPTVPETPLSWPGVYTLNTGDTRGAQQLGRYAANVGLAQAALLYPRTPEYERKAQAFAVEYEALGGEIRASIPYDSGTTTFATHMRRILSAVAPDTVVAAGMLGEPLPGDTLSADSVPAPVYPPMGDTMPAYDPSDPWLGRPPQRPFALFIPAPDADVRQIAPQVAFYGLDSAGVQVFGDEGWTSLDVRRRVAAQDLHGVIAASHYPPDRSDTPLDPEFIRRYEEMHRQSLENRLPALGYDAANLVIQALPHQRLTPDALHFRFRLLSGIRGATGELSVRANRIVRTPFLVQMLNGGVAPAPFPWEYEPPVPRPPLPPEDTVGNGPGGRR